MRLNFHHKHLIHFLLQLLFCQIFHQKEFPIQKIAQILKLILIMGLKGQTQNDWWFLKHYLKHKSQTDV